MQGRRKPYNAGCREAEVQKRLPPTPDPQNMEAHTHITSPQTCLEEMRRGATNAFNLLPADTPSQAAATAL